MLLSMRRTTPQNSGRELKREMGNDLSHLVDGGMEAFVLGTILRDGETAFREVSFLTVADFAIEKHRLVWRAISDVAANVQHPRFDAVTERLSQTGKLDAVGGLSGLVDLDGHGIPGIRIAGIARTLQKKAVERRACRLSAKLASLVEIGLETNADEVSAVADELRGFAQGSNVHGSIITIEDLPPVGEASDPIRFLREPELPVGAIVGLTGDSGSGKSTLATAWVRDAIAQEIPVLVLDRENPRPVILDRMARLGLYDGPLLRWYGGWAGDVASPAASEVIDWARACEPRPLIVIDSVIAFLGGDENDAAVMRGFMNGARRLVDVGCSVVVIHHDGKADSARDYRGSSDFKAAVDQAFHITNVTTDGKLDRLSLRCYKSRYGLSGSLIYLYAGGRFVRDDRDDAPAVTTAEQLTAILRMNPGIGSKQFEDLAAKDGLGRNRARDFLSNGVLAGSIRREEIGRNRFQHYLPGDGN